MHKCFNKAAKNLRAIAAILLTSVFAFTAAQSPNPPQNQRPVIAAAAIPLHPIPLNPIEIASRPPTLATSATIEKHNLIVLRHGPGGEMNEVLGRYEKWIREGKYIVIDGRAISADAFGAFNERYKNRVCYTDNAVFSPHAARYRDTNTTVPHITERLARTLIPALEREFRASSYFNRWQGSAYISASRLKELWPEGECSEGIKRAAARGVSYQYRP